VKSSTKMEIGWKIKEGEEEEEAEEEEEEGTHL
jgi:hypothetical protein